MYIFSLEKVDCVPEGATKSTEERYGIWWVGSSDQENDNNAKDHEQDFWIGVRGESLAD